MPSSNALVQQIVLNLIPTLTATLLEPFWVLLSRLACMMRPMEELREGESSAEKSLLLDYTSIPPQLIIWRALSGQDLLLAFLGIVAVLANVLTIALSGLLSQTDVLLLRPSSSTILFQPRFASENPFNGTGGLCVLGIYTQNDPFYVAFANMSSSTPLPPWVTPEYFFLPLGINSTSTDDGAVELNFLTGGYGADLDCQELSDFESDAMYNLSFSSDGTQARIVTSHRQPDGNLYQCKPFSAVVPSSQAEDQRYNSTGDFKQVYGEPSGTKALEFSGVMISDDNHDDVARRNDFCTSLILKGWLRAVLPTDTNSSSISRSIPALAEIDATVVLSKVFMTCRPRVRLASFNVTISPSGSIHSAVQESDAIYDIPTNVDLSFALNLTRDVVGGIPDLIWHNDTFATDWTNYLLKALINSTTLLDATLPVPDFQTISNLTSNIFSRLFAIQMSLQTSLLMTADPYTPPQAVNRLSLERRVFISEKFFRIAVAILALDLVVAVVFYCRAPSPFLPRMPTNIANQLAYFAGSHVIDDVARAGGDFTELDRRGYRYGYGEYVGKDGWRHLGIERAPYVTPLEADSGLLKWLFWKRVGKQGKR